MSKVKAWFVAGLIMIFAGAFIYSLWQWQIRSYYVVIQVLGWYGFVMAGINLTNWLTKEDPNNKRPKSYQEWAEYNK